MKTQTPKYLTVLVCGAREWSDTEMVQAHLEKVLGSADKVLVLTGGARGADKIAQEWAMRQSRDRVKLEVLRADWKGHGKKAGMLRNQEMLKRALELQKRGSQVSVLAFKDGFGTKPTGTEHMVNLARTNKITGAIVRHVAA